MRFFVPLEFKQLDYHARYMDKISAFIIVLCDSLVEHI